MDLALCNKIFNILGWIYIIITIAYVLAVVPMFFLAMSMRMSFGAFVGCAVFCIPACIALDWYGIYRKHRKAAIYAIIPAFVGILFVPGALLIGMIDLLLCVMSIVCAVLVSIFGKKYHYLEEQEGFPHFSELHTEEVKRNEAALNSDPYARDERFYAKEDVRGKMDELPDVTEKLRAKEDLKNDYMDSI
ncbi:MAG: hypothetical protein IJ779_05175 [Ruminococcus sp.]|nr:hypothetical protein [Ruminococcus sp.]